MSYTEQQFKNAILMNQSEIIKQLTRIGDALETCSSALESIAGIKPALETEDNLCMRANYESECGDEV